MDEELFNGPDGAGRPWRLSESVIRWAQVNPLKTAFIDYRRSVKYAELEREVMGMRGALTAAGLKAGDTVSILTPSCIEFAVILFASMHLGVNVAPLDMQYAEGEVERRLGIIQPKLVFVTTQQHADEVANCGIECVGLERGLNGAQDFFEFLVAGMNEDMEYRPLSDEQKRTLPALTILTSGSTGTPKGVLLSEVNLTHANQSFDEAIAGTPDDIFLTGLPMSHLYGVNSGVLQPMMVGATSVLLARYRSEDALDAIQKHHVTVFNGVPSMYKRMVSWQEKEPRDLSSIRVGSIAGALCTNLEEYQRVLNIPARILYGLSESPFIAVTRPGDSLDTTETGVGRFLTSIEPRIIDDKGNPLPQGQEGEIVVKSPGTMLGYLNNPDATNQTVDAEGWAHTGDIGYEDEKGYVHIVGRVVDVINRGGYKVFPAEIEGVYGKFPGVVDCRVLGLPHKELGQQIVLFIALSDSDATPGDLRDYAKGKVAKYKIPDQVMILDKIPYLPNGKSDKKAMIKLFEESADVFHDDAERKQRSAQ